MKHLKCEKHNEDKVFKEINGMGAPHCNSCDKEFEIKMKEFKDKKEKVSQFLKELK